MAGSTGADIVPEMIRHSMYAIHSNGFNGNAVLLRDALIT